MADGALGIVFQHCNGHSALLNAAGQPFPLSFVYGQKSNSPCINSFCDHPFLFGVNLQPTAFKKLFNINTHEITDTLLTVDHLFPKHFTEQLLHATSPEQISSLFNQQLLKRLQSSKEDKIIDHSIQLILADTKNMGPNDLSSLFPVSRRHFQRKFREHLGVCPESYMRIIKFQRSIHLLKTRQYSKLSDIAFSLNYADQSHFVREFKLFAGCTPKEFLVKSPSIPVSGHHNPPFETMRILIN